MDWSHLARRFRFLGHALNGSGGFNPSVTYAKNSAGSFVPVVDPNATYLVRYGRESDEKFARRVATAVYENHLLSACERFVSFLRRRAPTRKGAEGGLSAIFSADCDQRGTPLDSFLSTFSLEAKARGSLLLVIDKPREPASSLREQIERRGVPYLRIAYPEDLIAFEVDIDSGQFVWATLQDQEYVDGKLTVVQRTYTATTWEVKNGDTVLVSGEHPFGQCPVIPFTESGHIFPRVGKFAQVADLSKAIFSMRSQRDEQLSSVTFPLLHLQVPAEATSQFNPATVSATIGVHSMLVHSGEAPGFIAPPEGPAKTYLDAIDRDQTAISRITMEDVLSQSASPTESGLSRKLRFEALNADLAGFAKQLQNLERRVWHLFGKGLGTAVSVTVEWPTDYNIADVMAEIDILDGMQRTGFPAAVLAEKRRSIAAVEFDASPDATKASIDAACLETAQDKTATDPPTSRGASGQPPPSA